MENTNAQTVNASSTTLPIRSAVPLTPATPAKPTPAPVNDDTLITIKLYQHGHEHRRVKIALKDLGLITFPKRIRRFIGLENSDKIIKIERFSDTTVSWVSLDNEEPAVYKQMFRAAKSKLKLRVRVTVVDAPITEGIKNIKIESSDNDSVKDILKKEKEAEKEPLLAAAVETVSPPDHVKIDTPPMESEIKTTPPTKPGQSLWPYYSIFCDRCDESIAGEHRHCSICSNGDYDLCLKCKSQHCEDASHFLITRTVDERGVIVASSTSKAAKKPRPDFTYFSSAADAEVISRVNRRLNSAKAAPAPAPASSPQPTFKITCNNCVKVIDPKKSVQCKDCPDFDLCLTCFTQGLHGHSELHEFAAGDSEQLTKAVRDMLAPGRGVKHFAICDACEHHIHGIRHKCSVCPDYDLCAKCFDNNQAEHQHTFIPLARPLVHQRRKSNKKAVHNGVTCDGPMCKTNTGYIIGDRYKCAICDDHDLCANCEAMPGSNHSDSHPMIKMKQAIQGIDITTYEKSDSGEVKVCGDYPAEKSIASPSELQPFIEVVNMKPVSTTFTEPEKVPEPPKPVIKPVDIFVPADPVDDKEVLDAWFCSETISDGMFVHRGETLFQSWKMQNPLPKAWPVGSRLVLESGAYMIDLEAEEIQTPEDIQHVLKTYPTDREIKQNQSYTFGIAIRAPQQEGVHRVTFRMQSPDGVSFGPRVWCEVNVLPMLASPDVSHELIVDTEAAFNIKLANLSNLRAAYEGEIALAADLIAEAEDTESLAVRKATAVLHNRDYLLAGVNEAFEKLERELNKLYPYPNPSVVEPVPFKGSFAEASSASKFVDFETAAVHDEVKETESEAHASQLILPALEKESPTSSIHQEVAATEAETKEVKTPEHDDLHSVEAPMEDLDLDSSDGFITDEEYDIVDDESEW